MANRVTKAERQRRAELLARGMYVCARLDCPFQGQPQSLDQFTRESRAADGVGSRCLTCRRAYRDTDAAKAAIERYNNSARGRAKIRERAGRSRMTAAARNFMQARWTVANAVALGSLPPANNFLCALCRTRKARDYHHHRGYQKPHWRDVVPVCRFCHATLDDNPARKPGPRGPFQPPRQAYVPSPVCKKGHPFTRENTAIYGGRRVCRICHRRRSRDAKARAKT